MATASGGLGKDRRSTVHLYVAPDGSQATLETKYSRTTMLAGFALAHHRKQDEELMEQLSGGGSVWEAGCVGVAGVVMSFIKREFNDRGYCDEGENGPDDSDVDNGRSKCNGTVCGPAKPNCSELPRAADADDVLVDNGYGDGDGYGWQVRMQVTGAKWRVAGSATGGGRRRRAAGGGWPVAGGARVCDHAWRYETGTGSGSGCRRSGGGRAGTASWRDGGERV